MTIQTKSPLPLLVHCEPYSRLFDEVSFPLQFIASDQQLASAIDAVLRRGGLGSSVHLLTMVKSAASPEVSLPDRLALRAILNDDEERAARIWRAELEGRPISSE